MISFVLECTPTAQQRPRHARTKTGLDMTYKSSAQKANERTLEAMLLPYRPKMALEGGLELIFKAVMPLPSSMSKKTKIRAITGQIGHTVKPDLDNLAKQLKDAMTRMRFWRDDKQVIRLFGEKVYGENPHWEVSVKKIAEER